MTALPPFFPLSISFSFRTCAKGDRTYAVEVLDRTKHVFKELHVVLVLPGSFFPTPSSLPLSLPPSLPHLLNMNCEPVMTIAPFERKMD